jgi:small subunit ribosomal protein S8
MSLSDPIANLLTKIRNAVRAKHRYVDTRHTKLLWNLMKVLQGKGFVDEILVDEEKSKMRIFLKYAQGRESVIEQLTRISSPGRRRYIGYRSIPRIDGGMGLIVLSTPAGIIDGELARERKMGGELLCSVR